MNYDSTQGTSVEASPFDERAEEWLVAYRFLRIPNHVWQTSGPAFYSREEAEAFRAEVCDDLNMVVKENGSPDEYQCSVFKRDELPKENAHSNGQ